MSSKTASVLLGGGGTVGHCILRSGTHVQGSAHAGRSRPPPTGGAQHSRKKKKKKICNLPDAFNPSQNAII
jgi:hypothetical protein